MCNGDNVPSMRLMERLGMRREAFFVQGEMLKGQRADLAVYAMLATESTAAARLLRGAAERTPDLRPERDESALPTL